jgi:uncharacterized repeat protein (TIGR01451 family)
VTDILKVKLLKEADKTNVIIGDTITYSIKVDNQSTIAISNVVVKDTDISPFLSISNIKLNDVAVPPGQNLQTGILIASIPKKSEAIITFEAVVLEGAPDVISNIATGTYLYKDGDTTGNGDVTSNEVEVDCVKAKIEITKSATKNVVKENGEEVQYILSVYNSGNVLVSDIIVTDAIPTGMTYVPNSTIIGANPPVNDSPVDGINIGSLAAGATQTVKFSVSVSI